MKKTERRYRNPAYDPLEETQENPALPLKLRPARKRQLLVWAVVAVVGLATVAVIFY